MPLSLVFRNPVSRGKIYQAGWKEIPSLPNLAKIDVVVLAAKELPDPPKSKAGPYAAKVIRIPLDDNFLLDGASQKIILQKAFEVAQEIARYNQAGKNVIISCHMGLNRSGLITALSLKLLTGAPARKIIKLIRQQRSPYALSNPAFCQMILATDAIIPA